ncbi:NucA/NucB deoxyribonuclease domain-containing protein [Rhodococcoides kroppenstedtii]|uniref:NucA/NucB deoxyribonuclease domain-containing protein n=1 Tax=Rhodococcoides kroppenstedtii TaxID=293050 RepID=UPI003FA73229
MSSRGVGMHATHIQRAQQSGLPGAPGGTPLRRTTDSAQVQANRNSTCNTIPGPRPTAIDCDEYPFASTQQGGLGAGVARTYSDCNVNRSGVRVLDPTAIDGTTGAGVSMCFIDRTNNRRGGGILSWFYKKQRIANAEAFYVK